jgi:DNA-binding transcriptional LysR family regulator
MAQPPLSQAIRRLEGELGVTLLHRTTRQVALTRAGEVFRDDALRILAAVDEATARVRRFDRGIEGMLRIGLTGTASYVQLPRLARLVKQHLPDVALETHPEQLTPDQEQGLAESRLDLGVLRPPIRREGISWRPIARERLVAVLPAEHPLTAGSDLRVGELAHEGFITYPAASRSVVNDAVTRSCLEAGFYPHAVHDAKETSTVLALVAAGLGVAMLPESVAALRLDGVTVRPLTDAQTVDLALAWRTDDETAAVRTLLTVLDEHDFFLPQDAYPQNPPPDSPERTEAP